MTASILVLPENWQEMVAAAAFKTSYDEKHSKSARKMASRKAMADYWGGPTDRCWCCAKVGTLLQRAHLIDRAYGGADGVENLFLLCRQCHSWQESFTNVLSKSFGQEWVEKSISSGFYMLLLLKTAKARRAQLEVLE